MKKWKTNFKLLLAGILAAVLMLPITAQAADMSFAKELMVHTGTKGIFVYSVTNMPSGGKITSVKTSNKKVADVSVSSDKKTLQIDPKKAGKATLTLTVKYGSKKKVFQSGLQVFKYVNPVQSYKIDGKELKSCFNKNSSYDMKVKNPKKSKFSVKAKSGWKITSFTQYKNGSSKRFNSNSPTINLKKLEGGSVQINFTNQKTGLVENIVIWFK